MIRENPALAGKLETTRKPVKPNYKSANQQNPQISKITQKSPNPNTNYPVKPVKPVTTHPQISEITHKLTKSPAK